MRRAYRSPSKEIMGPRRGRSPCGAVFHEAIGTRAAGNSELRIQCQLPPRKRTAEAKRPLVCSEVVLSEPNPKPTQSKHLWRLRERQ
jgi:hypothetical protein